MTKVIWRSSDLEAVPIVASELVTAVMAASTAVVVAPARPTDPPVRPVTAATPSGVVRALTLSKLAPLMALAISVPRALKSAR